MQKTTELFGSTRNVVTNRYALLTPSGFVPGYLPGWEKAVCNVLISPAMGARFSQVLVTLEREGQCHGNTGKNQCFMYLLEGSATLMLDERKHRLEPGSFAYLPAGKDIRLKSASDGTRLWIFQKAYQPLRGVDAPAGPRVCSAVGSCVGGRRSQQGRQGFLSGPAEIPQEHRRRRYALHSRQHANRRAAGEPADDQRRDDSNGVEADARDG